MASMTSKYPVQSRFEQSKLPIVTSISFNEKEFQIVTQKRKTLGNLMESSVNTIASCTRSERAKRPPTLTKSTEKESGQQTNQFLSPPTDFMGIQTSQNMDATPSPSS